MHVSQFPGAYPQVGSQPMMQMRPPMPQGASYAGGVAAGINSMQGPCGYAPQAAPAQLGQIRPGQGSLQLAQRPGGSSLGNFEALSPAQTVNTRAMPVASGSREQALQQRVAELEDILKGKDQEIKELQSALSKAGIKLPSTVKKVKAREKIGSGGFRKVSQSQPFVPYEALDQDDLIDLRLEEFYNGTGSAIPFQRINRGFYRFGETIVELNIINHKLMARTEDGWNRSKFGPIEKFLMYYENIEREKAGIPLES